MKRLVLLLVLVLAGCGGGGKAPTHFTVESRLVGKSLTQRVVLPPGKTKGRPLLLLLHGRGAGPDSLASDELRRALQELGRRAPIVVLVNGGDHSYYHDRADGRWGSYVVDEVIPAAVDRLHADGKRVAIGGISMGGFGALDIARLSPGRFCAVGGHSAAIFPSGGDTPEGAFDDAEDFAAHDLLKAARANPDLYGRTRVWLDVGDADPFRFTDAELADLLRGETFHVWEGGHDTSYWLPNMADYLRFYAGALERC
jgi:S-formylglutathione hydrolase FrmB